MSYASQSTGHFAQFRDVTESNMNDILIYRHKNIWNLFSKKFEELISTLNIETNFEYKVTSLELYGLSFEYRKKFYCLCRPTI